MAKHPRIKNAAPQPKSNNLLWFGIAGIVLIGIALAVLLLRSPAPATPTTTTGDAQIVKMAINGIDYEPAVITVEANKPVRWEIDATKASGCMKYLNVPDFGIRRPLSGSSNVVEFTPTKKGTFRFTCSMGMGQGTLQVV